MLQFFVLFLNVRPSKMVDRHPTFQPIKSRHQYHKLFIIYSVLYLVYIQGVSNIFPEFSLNRFKNKSLYKPRVITLGTYNS